MLSAELVSIFKEEHLDFITGVPCSYLGDLLSYLTINPNTLQHITATSEGEAVGIAAGYYLATKEIPIIYMQNSGLGNAINPLTSLMDKEVYSIPALLLISWRGEPGYKDEPQHIKIGRIMLQILDSLEIPYEFASEETEVTTSLIHKLKALANKNQKPVALILRSSTLKKVLPKVDDPHKLNFMVREEILRILLQKVGDSPIVTTTGKTSREVFEIREQLNQSHKRDFLTVGSMGCASGIAFGISMQSKKKVYVIDGDGALLMKLGTTATVGFYQPKNYVQIIIDNGSYESTGAQPSVSSVLKWRSLFLGVGYKQVKIITSRTQLENLLLSTLKCPAAVIIYSKPGSRKDLGRPTTTPVENKLNFMNFLLNG